MATNQTVCRLLVGHELRRAREAVDLKQEDAAEHIGAKITKISRLELGQTRVSLGDVKMLLEFYGDDPQHIEAMLALARNSNQRGRWEGYRAAFPEWFRMYVDLEEAAEDVRHVQAEIIPGILQVEPYIRTIHAEWPRHLSDGSAEDSVMARKERQDKIFNRQDPPTVSFVLSESCLRRDVGGPAVMRAQLDYLADVAQQPNVQIQILPYKTKTYTGTVSFSFTLLTIGAPGIASPLEFAYVENYDDARYIDDKDAVRTYGDLWRRLTAAALGPGESVDFIRTAAKQYD
ncbi:helix-turn-helix domain-containing protein [Saccharopolyspora sp. NPDC003762]